MVKILHNVYIRGTILLEGLGLLVGSTQEIDALALSSFGYYELNQAFFSKDYLPFHTTQEQILDSAKNAKIGEASDESWLEEGQNATQAREESIEQATKKLQKFFKQKQLKAAKTAKIQGHSDGSSGNSQKKAQNEKISVSQAAKGSSVPTSKEAEIPIVTAITDPILPQPPQHGFFQPAALPWISILAEKTRIPVAQMKDYYQNKRENYLKISSLRLYLHNSHHKLHPSLSLEEVLATSAQQYLNLNTAYPWIKSGLIKIEEARNWSDEERMILVTHGGSTMEKMTASLAQLQKYQAKETPLCSTP